MDLRIDHEHVGSSSDHSINGHLRYPNDLVGPLNETDVDKIHQYHTDYNSRPSNVIFFMSDIPSTSGRIHCDLVCLVFLQTHRETDRFFATSGFQFAQSTSGLFHFLHTVFSSKLKSKVDNIFAKTVSGCITLNIGVPIVSRSHTHPCRSIRFNIVPDKITPPFYKRKEITYSTTIGFKVFDGHTNILKGMHITRFPHHLPDKNWVEK